jgi:hypothetical protein
MSTYAIPVTCLNCAGRLIHQGTGVPTMGRTETAATAVCAACGTDHLLRRHGPSSPQHSSMLLAHGRLTGASQAGAAIYG